MLKHANIDNMSIKYKHHSKNSKPYNQRINEMNSKRPDIPFGVLSKPVNINVNISRNDDIAGIYGIYDRITGARLYIGSSTNVYNRMAQHVRTIDDNKHSRSDLNDYDTMNLVFMLLTRCHHHIGDYDTKSSGRNELSYEEMRQFLMIRPLKFGITPDYIDIHADAPRGITVYKHSCNHDVRITGMKYNVTTGKYCFYYKLAGHDSIILRWDYDDFNDLTDYSRNGNSTTTEFPTMIANILTYASHDEKLAHEYGVPFITDDALMKAKHVDMMIKKSYCK